MRHNYVLAILAVLTAANANATNIWLSEIGCPGEGIPGECNGVGSPLGEVPTLNPVVVSTDNTIHVWGRPDEGKTMDRFSLNIHTTNPGVITFTNVHVLNPLLIAGDFPLLDTFRWEFVNDGAFRPPSPDGQRIDNFAGFIVAQQTVNATGMGPISETLDPYYDASNEAWQIATITYDVVAPGSTELFLQIGPTGLGNQGEGSKDTDVIFGNPLDLALNGDLDRETDSETPDALMMPMRNLGDMDLDEDVDFDDIEWFVLALDNATAYAEMFGIPPEIKGDIDGSGFHDFDDIDNFIGILFATSTASEIHSVPEPSSMALLSIFGSAVLCSLFFRAGSVRWYHPVPQP